MGIVFKSGDDVVSFQKFNGHHDPKTGRFTFAHGGKMTTFSANPNTKAGAKAIERENARQASGAAAGKHLESDKAQISDKIAFVRENSGTKVNPIERKGANLGKIMEEAGCDRSTAEKAAAEAKAVYDRYEKVEPVITSDILGTVKANNGKMYGLDFRMKQETSLGRKIAQDADADGITLSEAAANIKDGVRYTAMFETKDFTAGYNSVKSSLESKGYQEVRCKNFYEMYDKGQSVQKAVQCVYKDKSGNMFELQFHTYESQGAKEVNHPLYERERQTNTPKAEKAVLNQRMTNISSNVPDPAGVMSIKSHKSVR